ncbi:MAG: tetratricopeptide repeat protein [Spirochaetaceae bacterium]
MQRTDERDTKTRIADAISNLLTRHWKTLVITFAGIMVVTVAAFAYFQIQENRANEAARMAEELQEDYEAWQEAEEEERSSLEEAVQDSIDELVDRYGGTYAASRARMIRAEIHWEQEEWPAAAETYAGVAEEYRESHLAPVALLNASAAEEAEGNAEAALGHVETLIERYGDGEPTPELARALFTRGRMNEDLENYDIAADAYNRLVEEHPESSWTNLARNRIIALKTRGLIAE